MKKFLILLTLCCFNCEDVIDVDLNNTPPRLVIEASINWVKGTPGNLQVIKLTETAPFFNDDVPPATGATVSITNTSTTNTFNFIEEASTGVYVNSNFVPVLNQSYTLNISYNNQTYTATETLKPVASIDFVEQINDGGFTGNDIELKAFYTDPADEDNFYLFEFISNIPVVPTIEVYEDEFTNGNQIFGYYTEEDLTPGDQVIINNYGISQQFFNYAFILLQQAEGGGPFETQPTTVRGNCINTTNANNYPLGYFRLSEVDSLIYTIE